MRVLWSEEAIENLDDIEHYVAQHDALAAYRVVNTIYDYTNRQLSQYPELGRQGRVAGTRELVIPALPYIAAYRQLDREVQVVAVLHARRLWPDEL